MQYRFERLAESDRPGPDIWQGDFLSGMSYRFVAPKDFAHNRDVIAQAIIWTSPGLPIPSLDDLRPGDSETCDEAVTARECVDGCRTHGRISRRACGELHYTGAEADALGNRSDVCEWADRVGAVAFPRSKSNHSPALPLS